MFELRHNLHKVGNDKIDATRNFERQGGSVVRLSNQPRFTVTQQEDPRGVQNDGLRAPVYARIRLFIGGRQGLHRFTCVKAAWHKTHRKSYIELYCQVLHSICVDEYHREFENGSTFGSNAHVVCLKTSYGSI